MNPELVPLLVNGQDVTTGRTFVVDDPATEEQIAQVAAADKETTLAALEAAKKAFPAWSKTTLAERKAIALRYVDLLERDREHLTDLLVAETGKPRDAAGYDVTILVNSVRFFQEEVERIRQEVIPDPTGRFHHYVLRQALGVVVGFLAWNYPLLNLGYKLGPILATGCTSVIKPSRHTPLATLASARLLSEAGVPDGVVNVIACDDRETTRVLLQSDIPALVTMIGSTAAGLEVMRTASTSIKRYSLELGGNAPAIVYPDADLQDAVNRIVDLKFSNAGQVCVAPNRALVHAEVLEDFLRLAAERVGKFNLGSGVGPLPMMGPMITADARDRMLELVQESVADGAKVVCGGSRPEQPARGYFMQPTVLRDVRPEMRIAREEIFGPILPVIRFTEDEEALAMGNDTNYGLAAYVFTTNLSRALHAVETLQAGSVCVNEPHNGVHLPHGGQKQSGLGCDRSHYSLEEYMTLKRVTIRK
ncbi:MAG: aldehyde dehydrogenase family protein [Armatimonadia bacterium]